MPIGIGAGTAIAGIVGGGAAITAGVINSKAAGNAADAASASNAAALAFQKQQAEAEYKNQEVTRRANYDQYVAKQTAMNQVRQGLGLKPVDIPAYVPSVDPGFTGTAPAPTGQTAPAGLAALAGNGTPAPGMTTAPTSQPLAQQYLRTQAAPQGSLGFLAMNQPPPRVDANGNPIPPSTGVDPFALRRPIQT